MSSPPSAPSPATLAQHTQQPSHINMLDEMEDIELEHFPKYLPLRPKRQSRIVAALKRQPARILITLGCFLATIAGVAVGAWYVGQVVQKSYFEKHPVGATTVAAQTKSATTVMVTHASVKTVVLNMPTLVVVTETVAWSSVIPPTAVGTGPYMTPCLPSGTEDCMAQMSKTASQKEKGTASPGRQKPEK